MLFVTAAHNEATDSAEPTFNEGSPQLPQKKKHRRNRGRKEPAATASQTNSRSPVPTRLEDVKPWSWDLPQTSDKVKDQSIVTRQGEDLQAGRLLESKQDYKPTNKIQLVIIEAVRKSSNFESLLHKSRQLPQPAQILDSVTHISALTSSTEESLQFIDFPYEITKHIVEYAVLQNEPVNVDAFFRTINKVPGQAWQRGYGIIYTCQALHEIGREAYYSVNTFSISLGLFTSLPNTMKEWPSVGGVVSINMKPALRHVQYVEVRRVHEQEYCGGPFWEQWGNMVQLLLAFDNILSVNIDTRDCEQSAGCDTHEITKPAKLNMQVALARTGVRCGWTKKEATQEGVKDGSLFVTVCGHQGLTSNNWCLCQILQGLDKKKLPVEGDESVPVELEEAEPESQEDENGLIWI
jgi:hypothetical protein